MPRRRPTVSQIALIQAPTYSPGRMFYVCPECYAKVPRAKLRKDNRCGYCRKMARRRQRKPRQQEW